MLRAHILQPGAALASLPQHCRQPLSQLPSLKQWGLDLTRRAHTHARPHSAHVRQALAVETEPIVREDSSDAVKQTSPLINRNPTGRLRSPITDAQGRLMLKNLTKTELEHWLEQQGIIFCINNIQTLAYNSPMFAAYLCLPAEATHAACHATFLLT